MKNAQMLTRDAPGGGKVVPKLAKICFLTSVPTPFSICARILYREAMSLARRGFEVVWVAPSEEPRTWSGQVRIVGFPAAHLRTRRWLNTWQPLVLALREQADLYHFHDPELIPCALLLRLITRKPVIYDVHEHYPDAIRLKEWIHRAIRPTVATLFDYLEPRTAPFFDAIITADDDVAGRFRKAPDRLVTLYNFPTPDFCQTPSIPQPRRAHAVQLIQVGCLCPERGLWLMLDVVRILVGEKKLDVGLWIIGPFDSEEKRREFTAAVAADELLRGRVICTGAVPQDHLGSWLAAADIGLVPLQPVPKFHKNIPTKMFEYMAAGLPMVGSDLPPIRRYLLAADAGLLAVPDDPRSHADKILSLVQDPELAGRLGDNGRVAFQTRYNWTTEEEKLVSLYHELLNLPVPAATAGQ